MSRLGFKWPRCARCGYATYVCAKRGCQPRSTPIAKEATMPKTAQYPKPVLVLRDGPRHRVEIYLLNPGEHFPNFGGSSRGLTVSKTASLITRRIAPWGTEDTELDLADRKTWDHYARCLSKGLLTVDASGLPAPEDEG